MRKSNLGFWIFVTLLVSIFSWGVARAAKKGGVSSKKGSPAALLKDRRLIMKDTSYAGMRFLGMETVEYYAEATRESPVYEARVRWVADDVFYTSEKGRVAEQCPPRNRIIKVLRISEKSVALKEYWTGWPDSSDTVNEYQLVP